MVIDVMLDKQESNAIKAKEANRKMQESAVLKK